MNRKIKLTSVATPFANATILKLGITPAFNGTDHEDLLCASCAAVLANGVSLSTLTARFAAPAQLLVLCPCGTYNRLPLERGN